MLALCRNLFVNNTFIEYRLSKLIDNEIGIRLKITDFLAVRLLEMLVLFSLAVVMILGGIIFPFCLGLKTLRT